MIATVAMLIVPVTLQILVALHRADSGLHLDRGTGAFLFIWMVMLGAMIGVREGTHFEVDVWPQLGERATTRCCASSRRRLVLVFALVFVWWGIEFTRFGWDQVSEIAELPMWTIFIAWPLAGFTWVLFLGESFARQSPHSARARRMTGVALTPALAAAILFGGFFLLLVAARAGGFRARPGLSADPGASNRGCPRSRCSTKRSRPTTRSSCWRCRSSC